MKMLKPLLILTFLSLLLTELSSQAIIRHSISCFGNSNHFDGGVVSETVGQAYFTPVFSDPDTRLSPGFQQRMTAFIRERETLDQLEIKLYPNPASEELHLVASYAIEEARIEIIDVSGKVIFLSENEISLDKIIDLEHFAGGIYTIRITDVNLKRSHSSNIIIIK